MQTKLSLPVVQDAMRLSVCTHCQDAQPPLSHGPKSPRPCENRCPIFMSLPDLLTLAEANRDSMLNPFELAMRELVCSACKSAPNFNDLCQNYVGRICPLCQYTDHVIQTLERVADARL